MGDYPLALQVTRLEAALSDKAGLLFQPRDPQSMAIVMAACILFIAPMLIMYMILQSGLLKVSTESALPDNYTEVKATLKILIIKIFSERI